MEYEKTGEERRVSEISRDHRDTRQRIEESSSDTREPTASGMKVENLSAYYGSFKAITDVSMDIQANKVTAIIGPSGCGKSTFIRCLNRMHEVVPGARAEGAVMLGEQNISEADFRQLHLTDSPAEVVEIIIRSQDSLTKVDKSVNYDY